MTNKELLEKLQEDIWNFGEHTIKTRIEPH